MYKVSGVGGGFRGQAGQGRFVQEVLLESALGIIYQHDR